MTRRIIIILLSIRVVYALSMDERGEVRGGLPGRVVLSASQHLDLTRLDDVEIAWLVPGLDDCVTGLKRQFVDQNYVVQNKQTHTG